MDFNVIAHSGVAHDENPPGRGSGRFPYGSGENPEQHQFRFKSEVQKLKEKGFTDTQIAKALLGDKATTTDLKAEKSIISNESRQYKRWKAEQLLKECDGNTSEVGRRMGINESSVRSLLNEQSAENMNKYQNTAEIIKKRIDSSDHPVDVSANSELYMNVTDSTKKVALSILENEGYVKSWVKIKQMGTGHETSVMVMAKPGTTYSEIQKDKLNIVPIQDFSPDQGKTWWTPKYPESISSKRVYVRYAEEGGINKDGVIELRKGVEDISLGNSSYAQVRIAVDGTHYIKGMAMYADDIPKGYDVVFNTNKKKGTPLIGEKDHEVLKPMKKDERTGEINKENPFGALIMRGGQREYDGPDGKKHLSVINKIREEGEWDSWSRTLASQFLSKQPLKLINQQIDATLKSKQKELDEINSLTNPSVKQKLLDDFAGKCDSTANDLNAKGFKGQAYQVILPVPSLKDNEIYAPNFKDGEHIALVRYPHGGTFEIPVLVNNKKQKIAKGVLGNAKDAIGINLTTAEILSGADFDGDTVLTIPMDTAGVNIKRTDPLPLLKNFDPKSYKLPDDAPRMKSRTKGTEMGKVTNLIMDMQIGGADMRDVEKAVAHSMVVIDAEKHHLDYKQSAKDFGIRDLKAKYQGVNPKTGMVKGASTIITRAGADVYVNERKIVNNTKEMTSSELKRFKAGKVIYHDTGATITRLITDTSKMTPEELKIHMAGKKVYRKTSELKQIKVPTMSLVDDAMELVRDPSNKKEVAYAQYANKLKAMADEARRTSRNIKPEPINQSAKRTYANEVASLDSKLRIAKMNSPRERQAQTLANQLVSEQYKSNPDMDSEHRKRAQALAITKARAIVGASKEKIEITDKEWEAIQSHAISTSKLKEILNNSNMDAVKQRAMPRDSDRILSPIEEAKIRNMLNNRNMTQAEVAEALGISVSTVHKYY